MLLSKDFRKLRAGKTNMEMSDLEPGFSSNLDNESCMLIKSQCRIHR